MKYIKQKFLAPIIAVLSIALMLGIAGHAGSATAVDLNSASGFGVLAGSSISDTFTSSDISGDVGLSPVGGTGIALLSCTDVTGTIYDTDGGYAGGHDLNNDCLITDAALLDTAKADASIAYNDVKIQATTTKVIKSQTDSFADTGYTLSPGVYTSGSEMGVPANLTLDGGGDSNAVFIFKAGSTLHTVSGSTITLTNGAKAENIFWQVGSDARLGAGSVFEGTIMAAVSITDDGSSIINGRLLADADETDADSTGAVNLDNTTIITPGAPATLNIVKNVINDDGGTAVASDFNVHVQESGVDVTGSPQPGEGAPGTAYELSPGDYTVSEDAFSGYSAAFSGDCAADGTITLGSGDALTCTITNNDIAPETATLNVVKEVINDDGGTAVASDFIINVTGTNVSPSSFTGSETGVEVTLDAGSYGVTEEDSAGYSQSGSIDCSGSIAEGETKTCTITNDDIAPEPSDAEPADTAPPKNPSIFINDNAELTSSREVVATVSADGADWVEISQDPDFLGAAQVRYNDTKAEGYDFKLSLPDGEKTIYARFMDAAGNFSEVVSDNIFLRTAIPKLGVDISADPSAGEGSIEGVNLTAEVFGTAFGTINYTFYCNRIDTDATVIEPWDVKFDNVSEETLTAQDACSYASPGTYVAKVVAERENLIAEARTSLVVKSLPEPTPEPEPEPELQEVEREPEPAQELPVAPGVSVPSFSDQSRWYNKTQNIVASWQVPADIEAVSAVLDRSPATESTLEEPQLTTGKNFGPVADGVWYVHVRFRNSVGWGPATHYKIQIDRTPPELSAITIDKQVSQDPTRQIQYRGSDDASGIAGVRVRVDGGEPLVAATLTSATLPPLGLGEHSVKVAFVDNAGNTREAGKVFTVLPLTPPTVDFITVNVFEGDKIFAFGKSLPNEFVEIALRSASSNEARAADGDTLARQITTASFSGDWAVVFDNPYPKGSYAAFVNARDGRGAISKTVELPGINVSEKPDFTLGPISLGWLELALITALIIALAGSIYGWYWLYRKKIKLAYKGQVELDLEKYVSMIATSVHNIENAQKLKSESRVVEEKAAFDNIKKITGRIRKYLSGEIRKL